MGSTLLKFLGPEEVHIMLLHPVCEWAVVHLKNICKRCKRTRKKLATLQQVEGNLFTCWQMTNPLRENLQVLHNNRLTGLQTARTKLTTTSDHAGEIPWLWWVIGLMDLAAGMKEGMLALPWLINPPCHLNICQEKSVDLSQSEDLSFSQHPTGIFCASHCKPPECGCILNSIGIWRYLGSWVNKEIVSLLCFYISKEQGAWALRRPLKSFGEGRAAHPHVAATLVLWFTRARRALQHWEEQIMFQKLPTLWAQRRWQWTEILSGLQEFL